VRNSESYFLQIGQELGWAGLLLFIVINVTLAVELWKRRASRLALGLLAALIGLSIVNQFAYGWADETLVYLFWGLSGVALATLPSDRKRPKTDA
jgi:apolipoprotein N-acyltransferase